MSLSLFAGGLELCGHIVCLSYLDFLLTDV
jgi:hypothetical protein